MKLLLLLAIVLACVLEEVVGQAVVDDLVPMGEKFKKFCLDLAGNKYKKNEKLTGMCEEFTCSNKKKNYFWKAADLKTCCKENNLWYPMNNIVYTVEYGPSTAMNHICNDDLQVSQQIELKGCSVFGQNLPPNEQILWAEKCAVFHCFNDIYNGPTLDYMAMYEGNDCCEYANNLLADGDYAVSQEGYEVMCSKGMLNYVFPYINGTDPEFPGVETNCPEGNGGGEGGGNVGTGPGAGSDACTCGKANRATRIVGGEETEINELPWQVGLVSAGFGSSVWCGATLISDQWVMTAAHCTDGANAEDIEVLVGEHHYEIDTETTSLRMAIAEIVQHEDYNSQTTNVDFSLLKLAEPIDFSAYPNIRPACLPENDDNDYAGYPAIVSGWGTTESGGEVSPFLQFVDVNVLSNTECTGPSYGYGSDQITDQMLCANVEGGGKDSCQGDSGGPLVSPNPDLYELIGVVSWGVGCAWPSYPGVYARMSKQLAWVAEITAGSWNTCGRCQGEDCGAATSPATPAPGTSPEPTTTSEPSTCEAYPEGHTMNLYPGPSDSCTAMTLYKGFTDDGMEVILAKHNELRQKVAAGEETNGPQPAASDMMRMRWNPELATVAQRWADQCSFGHDDDRSKCDGTYVGQNAFSSWNSQEFSQDEVMANAGEAVQAWYDEVVEFGFDTNNISPFVFNYDAGHYTQVVWAESAEVGCGLSYYEEDGWFVTLVICNYAVGGNMQGGDMYTPGEGCSNCPAGTSCDADYPSLCA